MGITRKNKRKKNKKSLRYSGGINEKIEKTTENEDILTDEEYIEKLEKEIKEKEEKIKDSLNDDNKQIFLEIIKYKEYKTDELEEIIKENMILIQGLRKELNLKNDKITNTINHNDTINKKIINKIE